MLDIFNPPFAMFQVRFFCSTGVFNEELWLAEVEFKLQAVKLGNQLDRLHDDRTAAIEAIASIQAFVLTAVEFG